MGDDAQGRQRKRRRLWLALALVAALASLVMAPPLLSVSRYKSQITRLMATSLGRPVRLSSVELRLLPRPGFVLTDLTVEEDPAFGAEPLLHANTVTASFRMLALWRGRLEISRISVDEASLNLVRNEQGVWNLDPLFRTAAAKAGPASGDAVRRPAVPLPYLEATNSRVNIKNGVEKLPFSLLNTDLSFWREAPGDWRVRLRGQPARTDVSLDLFDTGVVQLEASLRGAPELRKMPLYLDLEWREAQLGQLTRLVIGYDPGWRGNLTGELHMDGTADAAQITTRLRAEGVHRAEFAPAAPLDFDARCGFLYHFSERAIENLACDSPLGDGRIHLAGELPGDEGKPHFSVELDRIPVQAGLDALRTVRSGLGSGLEARGTVSGKITYAETGGDGYSEKNAAGHAAAKNARMGKGRTGKGHPAEQGPLTGSLTVDGFLLSGASLSQPIQLARVVLQPAVNQQGQRSGGSRGRKREEPQDETQGQNLAPALVATAAIAAGGAQPLAVGLRLNRSGYHLTVRGQASVARARELAHAAGMARARLLDGLAGDPVSVDLDAEGPWRPAERNPFSAIPATGPEAAAANGQAGTQPTPEEAASPAADRLNGTVTFRNVSWKADFLANRVVIAQATMHLDDGAAAGEARWDPVDFSYGAVKGSASLSVPAGCDAGQTCTPHFEVQFGALDAAALQAAILGAKDQGTLLSELIARLRPAAGPVWPQLEGTVKADSLILGLVTLREPSATLRILQNGADLTGLDAGLLGGRVQAAGTLRTAEAADGKPSYKLEGHFEKLSPPAVGQLLGMRWRGGDFDADGKIELAGFTGKDLAASANGTLHFEWRHGAIAGQDEVEERGEDHGQKGTGNGAAPSNAPLPRALSRFDRWTADADIANGKIVLTDNEVQEGARKQAVGAALTLDEKPKAVFSAPKETVVKKR